MTNVELQSTITCPNCSSQSRETMPTDACQFFWKCPSCETIIRPKDGDCCVFCSYGDTACPPIQNDNGSASCC
ncbi:MAG: GDCCVxC domain-containing (seleno)protein [Rhodothermales bacterium]